MHVQHTNIHVHLRTQCHTHTCTHNTMCTQDGTSSLYIASQNGHDRIVEMLLQAGATVDLQDKVEDCYLFICHLCCAMHCEVPQHSGEYECRKTYPTVNCCWSLENQIISALEVRVYLVHGLRTCIFKTIWTENASLGSKLQWIF